MNRKLHVLFLNSWYPSRISPKNGDFIQRHAETVSIKHKVTSIHVITDSNLKVTSEIIDFTLNDVRTFTLFHKYGILGAGITSAIIMWFSGFLSLILFIYHYKRFLRGI